MGDDGCIFCKVVAGEIPATKVYEDDIVVAFLDIGPISDGHTLVVPRQHCKRLHECSAELLGEVCSRIGRIAGAVVAAMGCEGYNVLCNNGRAAGQLVDHVHFHIIPRNTGDGVFNRWPAYKYQEGQAEIIAAKVREFL